MARIAGIPLIGSYHTELAAYAGLRSSDPRLELAVRAALSAFYASARWCSRRARAADESLAGLGIEPDRIERWARGVDLALYDAPPAIPTPTRARSRSSTPAG